VARRLSLFFRFLAALTLLLGVSYRLWLPLAGLWLIHDDGPAKADVAVVLGGDSWGHRMETAGMLVRRGYVSHVLVSGPPGSYDLHESDLAIPFAVRHGYPAEWFEALPHSAMNTRDEAWVVLTALRDRGVHQVLIVTSDFHTARARRTYLKVEKAMGGGPEIRMVAAPDQFFRANTWWRGRESQKVVLMEWAKTLGAAVGY
jgi:uncharacterized SAM-binding protein YcdF (DUF218 family)